MSKTIISIWPLEQTAIRPRYAPISKWELQAAPFDGFVRLVVNDAHENDYFGGGRTIQQHVPAKDIAYDLAREFAGYTMGGSGAVGVWVSEIDDPTDAQILASEEYRRARAEQDKIMHNIVVNARELFLSNNHKAISKIHHMAAAYLNIQGEAWQGRNIERGQTKECPFCRTFIASNAVICPTCTQVVDPEGYAKTQALIKQQIDAISQQQTLIPDNGGSALRPALAKKGQ